MGIAEWGLQNRKIAKKMYEEFEKGKSNIENALDLFEDDQEAINHITAIMSDDYQITDTDKCVDDILHTYSKEKMINRKKSLMIL